MSIHVTSEIKPLKKVMLHRPYRELEYLVPESLDRLLFDDIPYLKVAKQEHDQFAQLLGENGVEVIYLEDLMAQTLDQDSNLRHEFIKQYIYEANIYVEKHKNALEEYLSGINSNKDLVIKTMEGIHLSELNLKETERKTLSYLVNGYNKLLVDPMPNLYFTRDPFASIGDGISLNTMYSVTRNRETIYAEYIFNYHPDYRNVVKYFNRYSNFHIEGGDILNLTKTTIAVGISQRTQPEAIEELAKNIFDSETSSIDTILAFDIPNTRAFMHLDTVFTQIDYDKFTIHPGILGPLRVFELKKADNCSINVKEINTDLQSILSKYLGLYNIELIQCGGGDRIAAEREQWNDGSNTLCISPGKIIVYERNNVTNDILREKGLEVIEIPSAELSRGRGGPRCMSMPLLRED